MSNVIPLRRNPEKREIEPQFFRVDDIAVMIDLSPTTVRRMISSGEIKAKRFGRSVRIAATEVERLKSNDSAA